MSLTAKTIQIFFPGGDPRGIRVAEVTTRIVQVLEVPRSLLGDFLKMPESGQVAVYFLFGESEDGAESKVYVGQTSDLRARLGNHNKEKGFWERALILISRTQSLTQTHAQFLEWHCLQELRRAARYADANGNCPGKPIRSRHSMRSAWKSLRPDETCWRRLVIRYSMPWQSRWPVRRRTSCSIAKDQERMGGGSTQPRDSLF